MVNTTSPIEKEVISIPAGRSYPFIRRHSVYACPNHSRWATYKRARYMTFRPTGGAMEMLYGLEAVITLDPVRPDWEQVPREYRAQVEGYISQRQREWYFSDDIFTFYVLSLTDQIPLLHKPRAATNLRGHVYFTFKELTRGEKIVRLESQMTSESNPSDAIEPAPDPLPTVRDIVEEIDAEGAEACQPVSPDSYPATEIAPDIGNTLEAWQFPKHLDESDPDNFDPEAIVDQRERVAELIVRRRGQAGFRQMLLRAYNSRCAITGYAVPAALEAAHIIGYYGPESDNIANGLLLRGDIHTLFDLHLLVINTQDMTVVLSPELSSSAYKYLAGKKLQLPEDPRLQPSEEALDYHRKTAAF